MLNIPDVNQGAAFVSAVKNALPAGSDLPAYDADYVPSLTNLNDAKIISPEDAVLSSYAYNFYAGNEYHFAETPYSLSDTSTPALDVLITFVPKAPDTGRQ